MSEDVDFKITPLAADSISLNQRRKQLGSRYTEFLQLMVYGVKPDFDEAMATIASLVGRL